MKIYRITFFEELYNHKIGGKNMIRKDLILESFKCKLIIALILSISIATLSGITTISANTNDRISNGTCSLDINKDIQTVSKNEKMEELLHRFMMYCNRLNIKMALLIVPRG